MKTHPPTDYDKTHRDDVAFRLSDSHMGETKQRTYFAGIVLFVAGFVVAGLCIAELWEIYLEAGK